MNKPTFVKTEDGIAKLTELMGFFYNEKGEQIKAYRLEKFDPKELDTQIIALQETQKAIEALTDN